MKKIICKTVLVLGLSGVASLAAAAGDAAKGEALVAVCAACHGADGNSAAPNFPTLAGIGEKYLLKQLQNIKAGTQEGGRVVPEMAGLLDAMTDQQLADIAAFYNSKTTQLSGAKTLNVQLNSGTEVDALSLAAKLYRAGNAETKTPSCSGCHSPTGMGNDPAGYPRLSGQHAAYIEKQLRDFRAGKRANDGEAQTMRGVALHLSDAEIVALANYIAGLN